jgi:hypothetical protein
VTFPAWEPLERPLTASERKLLDYLASFAASPELTAQAAAASVTAVCTCGCSSIQLAGDGPDVPASTIARLSPYGRPDHVGIGVSRPDEDEDDTDEHVGYILQVILHVGSRLLELEIYHADGERLPVPDPADLLDVEFS